MVFLDTNSLARFFLNDNPSQANEVKEILEKEKKIVIADIVLAELSFVLSKVYGIKKEGIIDAMRFILSKPNIGVSPTIAQAIDLFEKHSVSFVDALLASQSTKGKLHSFDKKLLRLPGVKKYSQK